MTKRVPIHEKLALSVPEVAELVGLSDPTVRRLVKQGHLARVPHTERVLVARKEVERWVTSTMPRRAGRPAVFPQRRMP